MLDPRWLMRMSQWTRRPPGWQRVLLMLAVLAACLSLAGLHALGLWPDWAEIAPRPKLR